MKKILCIFGTRPEAIKMVPVIKQMKGKMQVKVCVTAQHRHMLDSVLDIFDIKSDYDLNIMEEGQSLYHITTTCLTRLRKVFTKEKPDLVLVHGDTTTTFISTLAAFYEKIPVGHVEAGLRSFDKYNPYPEEINRVLTDKICDLLFAPTQIAKKNLLEENIPAERIFVTGNTVIDALHMALKKKHKFSNKVLKKLFSTKYPAYAKIPAGKYLYHKSTRLKTCRLKGDSQAFSVRYILVTAHRRENFGGPLENICSALRRIVEKYTDVEIIYPVHLNPNVQKPVRKILSNHSRIHLISPLDYLDFINLMNLSYFVVTDSGGLQEEAPVLGKPVLVLRRVTERPEAVKSGTAKVIGTDKRKIFDSISKLLVNKKMYNSMAKARNPYGDGKASHRIVNIINKRVSRRYS